jgi:uncharacterized protein (TIGR03066 family)
MGTDMKKLLSVFGILALCLTFAGCDKEDGDDKVNGSLLVGIWEAVEADMDDGEVDFNGAKMYYVFKKDGSLVVYIVPYDYAYYKGENTYHVNGNKLTIDMEEEEDEVEIVKLTSSELILLFSGEGGGTITFKKRTSLPDFEDYVEIG